VVTGLEGVTALIVTGGSTVVIGPTLVAGFVVSWSGTLVGAGDPEQAEPTRMRRAAACRMDTRSRYRR
jgi:hypothetical protein